MKRFHYFPPPPHMLTVSNCTRTATNKRPTDGSAVEALDGRVNVTGTVRVAVPVR
jgi:hypothetical protein